jgi:hypothetical protein
VLIVVVASGDNQKSKFWGVSIIKVAPRSLEAQLPYVSTPPLHFNNLPTLDIDILKPFSAGCVIHK